MENKVLIKKDILNNEPKIGDMIVFNPPKYKGLMTGIIVEFAKSGCPKVNKTNRRSYYVDFDINRGGSYSVKTDFIIVKN